MSKKTNTEKHRPKLKRRRPKLKRRHFRVPRGVQGLRRNPVFPPQSAESVVDGLMDSALGLAFVQMLKAMGLRDRIVEIVFCAPDDLAPDVMHEGSD